MLFRSVSRGPDKQGEDGMLGPRNDTDTAGSGRSLAEAPAFEPPLECAGGIPARAGGSVRRGALPCAGGVRRHGAPRRSPHHGRSATPVRVDENHSAAKQFAERTLRLVFEVLDGRRSAAQLRPLAEPAVLAAVQTLLRTGDGDRRLGAAVLVSVRVVPDSAGAAEVFGGYERGGRRFAVAARITVKRGDWRLTALRLR